MFSHLTLGVTDFDRACSFYEAVLAPLGLEQDFCEPDASCAAWKAPGIDRPLFVICHPLDDLAASAGNGQMTAFQAGTRRAVDQCHAAALQNDGLCAGEPGLRPHYHLHYYGAYFYDPDGNKIAIACHAPG